MPTPPKSIVRLAPIAPRTSVVLFTSYVFLLSCSGQSSDDASQTTTMNTVPNGPSTQPVDSTEGPDGVPSTPDGVGPMLTGLPTPSLPPSDPSSTEPGPSPTEPALPGDDTGGTGGGSDSTPPSSAGAGAGGGGAGGMPTSPVGGAGPDGSGGTPVTGGAGGEPSSGSGLGSGVMSGSGRTDERYETALVSRNDTPFVFITNGWGPGFGSHTIAWEGTSFIVETMSGDAGFMGQPASYPTVFCGQYSVMEVSDCGLPRAMNEITSLRTGWRWSKNGNEGEYNAAYDIWVGNGNNLQGYLMVWLRDPPSFQPAGSPNMAHQGVSVEGLPGAWNIWDGSVNGLPIINWVRAEGDDSSEIEFDVLSLLADAQARGLDVPGTHINAVAVGFEIWEGPINNLESVDFYVEVE